MANALIRTFPTLVTAASQLPVQPMVDLVRDRRRYLNGQEKFELAGQAIAAVGQMYLAHQSTVAEREQTRRHAEDMATERERIAQQDRDSERQHALAMHSLRQGDRRLDNASRELESGLRMAELAMDRGDVEAAIWFYGRASRSGEP